MALRTRGHAIFLLLIPASNEACSAPTMNCNFGAAAVRIVSTIPREIQLFGDANFRALVMRQARAARCEQELVRNERSPPGGPSLPAACGHAGHFGSQHGVQQLLRFVDADEILGEIRCRRDRVLLRLCFLRCGNGVRGSLPFWRCFCPSR